MARSRRALYSGPRATLRPARSQTATLQAASDKLAVELGLSSFLAGQDKATQRARYQIAARLITAGMASLTEAACSVTSKGRGAEIVAFKTAGEGE